MPVPKSQITPVRPRGGQLIHSTELGARLLGRTHCGRTCTGWVIVPGVPAPGSGRRARRRLQMPKITCQQCVRAREER